MDLELGGKRVLVTGSSRGIGLTIAKRFLQEGAKVVVTSRHEDDLKKIRTELSETFQADLFLVKECDFTCPNDIKNLKKVILSAWEGLDIIVANVGNGVSSSEPIPSEDQFKEMMALNFDAATYTIREFYPDLKKSNGNILFISSIAGIEAFGAPVDYATSKSALIAFSKNLARKSAVDGIRANCLAPGNIYFEGGSWDQKVKKNPKGIEQLIKSTVPMQRFGTPNEIADAALFLSSNCATFITGSTLTVDGGQTTSLI